MQFRKLMTWSAVFVAAGAGAFNVDANAASSLETQDVQIIKTSGDTQFVRYLDAVRTQNEKDARLALIAKLRQMRDDLRNYAMIARGGKMTAEQAAAGNVLKSVHTEISNLLSKSPGSNVDPQDNSTLDPLLFELGSN